MKSRKFKTALTAMLLVCALVLTFGIALGCQDDTPPTPSTYTVTFNANGGSAVTAQKVEKGKKAQKPTDPTKGTDLFKGWYKEVGLTTEWKFDVDTVNADVTLYAKWEAVPVAGELTWEIGTLPVFYSDMGLYNATFATESNITTPLASAVTAKEDGVAIQTIIDDIGGLERNAETGLIAPGKYNITYLTVDSIGAAHEKVVEVTVKAAETSHYYINFKTDRGGKDMGAVVGNRIRVAEDMYFESTAEGELPEALKNTAAEGKIKDYDDAYLLKNVSPNAMTINIADKMGEYLVFDKGGKVTFGYDGANGNVVNENNPYAPGKIQHDNAAFNSFDLPAGHYLLAIGYTKGGNWYGQVNGTNQTKALAGEYWSADKELPQWDMDGRQFLYMSGGYRLGNMVQLKKGADVVTDAYTNQLPYITKGYGKLGLFLNAALTDAAFTADITVWDDNGTSFAADSIVAKPTITVDYSQVDVTKEGTYEATYTIADSTNAELKMTFVRQVEVTKPAKYLQFNQSFVEYKDAKVNATNDDIAFRINTNELRDTTLLAYNNQFTGVKPSEAPASNKRPFNFASFVVYGADGTLKAWINASTQKLVYQGADGIKEVAVTGGKDMFKYFKLNVTDENVVTDAYVMQDGDTMYTAYHTGKAGNIRDFLTSLTAEIAKKTGDTVADKKIELIVSPRSYIEFNTTVKEVASVKYNQTNDDIAFRLNSDLLKNTTLLVYNNQFTGVKPSEAAASNKRPFNYASFVVYGADGVVKAWINASTQKLVYQGADGIKEVAVTEGKDMFKYFKLNATDENVVTDAYVMQDGDTMYTAFHTGNAGNLRDTLSALTNAIASKSGATVADKTIAMKLINY